MKKFLLWLALAGLIFQGGCNTPDARIKQNQELFSQLPPQDQDLIKQGKVAVGFTPDEVKLAVGDPDRIYTRTDASGTNETWAYTTYETDSGVLLYRGYYHRYYRWHDPMFPYYTVYPTRRSREYFRVVFTNGRVSAIEEQQR